MPRQSNRLEQSFRSEDLLPELLDLALATETTAVVMLLTDVIRAITGIAAVRDALAGDVARYEANWLDDPIIFAEVERGVRTVLEGLRPPGGPPLSESVVPPSDALDTLVSEQFGPAIAAARLATIAAPELARGHGKYPPSISAQNWERAIRDRLGAVLERLRSRLFREETNQ